MSRLTLYVVVFFCYTLMNERESNTFLDSGCHVVDSGFYVLGSGFFVSELGLRIAIVSGIRIP